MAKQDQRTSSPGIWSFAGWGVVVWTLLCVTGFAIHRAWPGAHGPQEAFGWSHSYDLGLGLLWLAGLAMLAILLAKTRERLTEEQSLLRVVRESEARYRSLIEQTQEPITVIQNGWHAYVNPAFARLLGYAGQAELLGVPAARTFAPEDLPDVEAHFTHWLEGIEKPASFEARLVRQDGARVWVELTGQLREYRGEMAVQAACHDVTARKASADALRESEEKFRTLSEQALMGVAIFQGDHLLTANAALAGILGLSLPETLGLSVEAGLEMVHPEDQALVRSQLLRKLARQEGAVERYEFRLLAKDGKTKWVELQSRAITYGRSPAVLLAMVDVSERKKAEEKLRASSERHRMLLDEMRDAAFVGTLEPGPVHGRFTEVNPAACALLGYTAQELIGLTPRDLVPPETADRLDEHLRSLAEEGSARIDWLIQRKDGSFVSVEGHSQRFELGGQQVVLTLLRDSTERRRAQQLVLIQRDLGNVLSGTWELKDALELILRAAVLAAGMDAAGVYLTDEARQEGAGAMTLVASVGLSEEQIRAVGHFPAGDPHAGLLASGNPFYGTHTELASRAEREVLLKGMHAAVLLPVYHKGQPIACLTLASYADMEMPQHARDALEGIVGHLATVLIRARAEEALRSSEERYRNLVENMDEGIVLVDGEMRVTYGNPAVGRLLGLPPEQLLGRSILEVIIPQHHETLRKEQEKRRQGFGSTYELRARRADGSLLDLQVTSSPRYDSEGDFAGSFALLMDITERRRAEAALRESEERYRELVSTMAEALVVHDAEGSYLFANPAADLLFGLSAGELIGRNLREFLSPEAVALVEGQLVLRREGEASTYELTLTRADGLKRLVRASGVPRFDAARQYAGSLVLLSDVTEEKRALRALRQSEERHRQLVENLPVGVYRTTPDGQVLLANQALVSMLGYSSFEELALIDLESSPDYFASYDRLWFKHELEKTGEIRGLEAIWRKRGGALTHVRENARMVRAVDGSVLYYEGTVEDISQQRQAALALSESEARLRQIIDLVPHFIFAKDREGHYVMTNRAVAEAYGTTTEEIVGRTDADFNPEAAEVDWFRSDDLKVISSGRPKLIPEERITDAQGRVRYLQTTKIPYALPGTGEPAVLGVSVDITERKRAEEELQQGRSMLQTLIDNLPVGVFAKTADGRYILWNRLLEEQYGIAAAAALGRTEFDIEEPGLAEQIRREDEQLLLGQRHVEIKEEIVHHPVLGARVLRTVKVPILGEQGVPLYILGISEDVTERKRAEEALLRQQKEESIVALAGGIAHDFNNILMGVLGGASLLADSLPPGHPGQDTCALISTAATRMADLTGKLLAYARGGRHMPVPLSLNDAVRDSLAMVRGSQPSQVEVRLMLADDLWPVEADAGQLHQLLLNLVVNGYEAMASSGGHLTLLSENLSLPAWTCERHPEHPAGDYVHLSVADAGAGMTPETLNHIFEPFFSTKAPGRGLGLAAVQGIVRNHGGCIRVESEVGRGTTFHLYLPRSVREPEPSGTKEAGLLGGTETILLVDDEELVLSVARRILERRGYTVLCARDGQEGLEIFQDPSARVDLAILDLQMPRMDGRDLAVRLRQLDPQLPMLISSGLNEGPEIDTSGSLKLGFINKPYHTRDLLQRVREALDAT